MSKMKMDNARDPDQLRKMEKLAQDGTCHYCPEGFVLHDAPIIYKGFYWYITGNDYPLSGSIHHYLIVSNAHITRLGEIQVGARIELFTVIDWLEVFLGTSGGSVFVRDGNMSLTGATIDHLHFHFVVGQKKVGNEPNKSENMIWAPVGYKKK